MSLMQEASIHEYIGAKTASDNCATYPKSSLQFHKRVSQCTYGRPISPAPPKSGTSHVNSTNPIPNKSLLDEFLTRTLKDKATPFQAESLDGMVIKGSKLSQRPDTPIPIAINPSLREEEKQSTQFPSRSTTPSKRRRTAGFGDDLYDLDEDGDQSPSDGVKRFACPYFRKDPERHLECINLKMVRISDVKQHLKRRHTAPYPCPICSEGFASLNLQGNHILQQACSPGLGANGDSVSLTSQRALQARFGKKLSQEAQWYGIWEILFGKPSNMPKPHLDGVVKEVIGILRGIWLDEGRRLISEFVQAKDQPPSYNDQLYQLLAGILDEVEARFEQEPPQRSSRKTSIGSEQGPEESAGVQLDTTFDFIGTEDAFPTDYNGGCIPFNNSATVPVDHSATASEFSEDSYQTSEFGFPGTHLLQTQYSYPDNPITDFDFSNYNQQQPVPMDGAML